MKFRIFKLCSMVTPYPYNAYVFLSLKLVQSSLNDSMVYDFSLIKFTQVNLEKSSTTTRTYLLPQLLATCIWPIKSMWRSSRTLEVPWCSNLGWDIRVCLSTWHSPQMLPSVICNLGIPLIASTEIAFFIPCRFKCPNFWSHSLTSSSLLSMHEDKRALSWDTCNSPIFCYFIFICLMCVLYVFVFDYLSLGVISWVFLVRRVFWSFGEQG